MAQITLTANQQKTVGDQVRRTEGAQFTATRMAQNKTDADAVRDACYADSVTALTELGYAPPDPITEIHLELDAGGAWTGKLYINEPLP